MAGWLALKRILAARTNRRLVVGLDFDGTLTKIVRRPGSALLPRRTKALLTKLARRPELTVALVSGRSLATLRPRARVPGLFFAGNHGLEIQGPGWRWTHPGAAAARGRVAGAAARLRRALRPVKGVSLEDKGLTFCVHYRGAAAPAVRAARGIVRRGLPPGLRLRPSKKAWDVGPDLAWNKGDSLKAIARRAGGRPLILSVGDDLTDEEGFRTLGPGALTVRVGPARRSAARFRAAGPAQVVKLLEVLARP